MVSGGDKPLKHNLGTKSDATWISSDIRPATGLLKSKDCECVMKLGGAGGLGIFWFFIHSFDEVAVCGVPPSP
jgi:hypothetical protein